MIISKNVEVNISSRNINHYKRFYNDLKVGMILLVNVDKITSGSDVKVDLTCDKCGILFKKKINNLNRDRLNNDNLDTCGYCARLKTIEKKRIDFIKVNSLFLEKNLIPLFSEKDKMSTNNKLEFKCKVHNDIIQSITYNGLLISEYPCKYCRTDVISSKNKKKYDEIYKYFIERNLIPLFENDEKLTTNSKNKFKCKIHENIIQEISYNSLKSTKEGCKICFNKKRESSSNWKGGITPLVRNMRSKINKWKFDKMKECGFKCDLTGQNGKLVVHHIENFHKLLEISIKFNNLEIKSNICEYSSEELVCIEKKLLRLHKDLEYSVLISELHNLFHKLYGKKNNNIDQFVEFKRRYYSFELDLYLSDKYKYSIISNHFQL
jgi:hypothetical protein